MIRGAAGRLWHDACKTQYRQVQLFNEGVDDTDGVLIPNVIVQALRQQDELAPVLPLNETLHPSPPHIPSAKYQI